MATMIYTPEIYFSNEVYDFIEIPRGTQITLSREVLEKNLFITIPDDLCDFIQVPHGTKMLSAEIERIGKKIIRDNYHFMKVYWDTLIFTNDLSLSSSEREKISKLFSLRALINPGSYPISDEMCEILDIPIGTLMDHVDLKNQVDEYIRVNKLCIHQNINLRNPDKLFEVLSIPMDDSEEFEYEEFVMKIIAYFVEKVQFAHTLKGPCMESIFMISDQLADFLEVAHGTQMSVAEAIHRVARYTYEKDLQMQNCKKCTFRLDDELLKLFSINENETSQVTYDILEKRVTRYPTELTYDALEKHVKKHLIIPV